MLKSKEKVSIFLVPYTTTRFELSEMELINAKFWNKVTLSQGEALK